MRLGSSSMGLRYTCQTQCARRVRDPFSSKLIPINESSQVSSKAKCSSGLRGATVIGTPVLADDVPMRDPKLLSEVCPGVSTVNPVQEIKRSVIRATGARSSPVWPPCPLGRSRLVIEALRCQRRTLGCTRPRCTKDQVCPWMCVFCSLAQSQLLAVGHPVFPKQWPDHITTRFGPRPDRAPNENNYNKMQNVLMLAKQVSYLAHPVLVF